MSAFIIGIIKKLGTNLLINLLNEIADTLQGRDDNTFDKDADAIKSIVKRNYLIQTSEK